jgi:hypothetical protein
MKRLADCFEEVRIVTKGRVLDNFISFEEILKLRPFDR